MYAHLNILEHPHRYGRITVEGVPLHVRIKILDVGVESAIRFHPGTVVTLKNGEHCVARVMSHSKPWSREVRIKKQNGDEENLDVDSIEVLDASGAGLEYFWDQTILSECLDVINRQERLATFVGCGLHPDRRQYFVCTAVSPKEQTLAQLLQSTDKSGEFSWTQRFTWLRDVMTGLEVRHNFSVYYIRMTKLPK